LLYNKVFVCDVSGFVTRQKALSLAHEAHPSEKAIAVIAF